jgi:hypothetical protein
MHNTSFPRRRESSYSNIPRGGQRLGVVTLRVSCLIAWIPACAGMTKLFIARGVA